MLIVLMDFRKELIVNINKDYLKMNVILSHKNLAIN